MVLVSWVFFTPRSLKTAYYYLPFPSVQQAPCEVGGEGEFWENCDWIKVTLQASCGKTDPILQIRVITLNHFTRLISLPQAPP